MPETTSRQTPPPGGAPVPAAAVPAAGWPAASAANVSPLDDYILMQEAYDHLPGRPAVSWEDSCLPAALKTERLVWMTLIALRAVQYPGARDGIVAITIKALAEFLSCSETVIHLRLRELARWGRVFSVPVDKAPHPGSEDNQTGRVLCLRTGAPLPMSCQSELRAHVGSRVRRVGELRASQQAASAAAGVPAAKASGGEPRLLDPVEDPAVSYQATDAVVEDLARVSQEDFAAAAASADRRPEDSPVPAPKPLTRPAFRKKGRPTRKFPVGSSWVRKAANQFSRLSRNPAMRFDALADQIKIVRDAIEEFGKDKKKFAKIFCAVNRYARSLPNNDPSTRNFRNLVNGVLEETRYRLHDVPPPAPRWRYNRATPRLAQSLTKPIEETVPLSRPPQSRSKRFDRILKMIYFGVDPHTGLAADDDYLRAVGVPVEGDVVCMKKPDPPIPAVDPFNPPAGAFEPDFSELPEPVFDECALSDLAPMELQSKELSEMVHAVTARAGMPHGLARMFRAASIHVLYAVVFLMRAKTTHVEVTRSEKWIDHPNVHFPTFAPGMNPQLWYRRGSCFHWGDCSPAAPPQGCTTDELAEADQYEDPKHQPLRRPSNLFEGVVTAS